ncbi:MAG: hypothetical protein P0Y65_11585 [Candidatus Devosia phytovorans]|uniref:Uncharacterized protein n=1 Tax=Candidatus Devosia phytovorans TaxID=3121372 RepID=A0AAJ5VSH3_9HYPH|nr:hypothetical protein [Devosia sp.]WEK02852.1 MAG: hypothetical protein P0Y65_11585 [Devosia sp.]
MTAITQSAECAITLPRWSVWRLFRIHSRRRRVTVDLIHSSPHLLRDIGAMEYRVVERRP